jgi:hypothetical protein
LDQPKGGAALKDENPIALMDRLALTAAVAPLVLRTSHEPTAVVALLHPSLPAGTTDYLWPFVAAVVIPLVLAGEGGTLSEEGNGLAPPSVPGQGGDPEP